jgi:hypothetical protein
MVVLVIMQYFSVQQNYTISRRLFRPQCLHGFEATGTQQFLSEKCLITRVDLEAKTGMIQPN